jgi:hypothetical protein
MNGQRVMLPELELDYRPMKVQFRSLRWRCDIMMHGMLLYSTATSTGSNSCREGGPANCLLVRVTVINGYPALISTIRVAAICCSE